MQGGKSLAANGSAAIAAQSDKSQGVWGTEALLSREARL
jgi:hypothetical protein